MRKLSLISALILCTAAAFAQTTKVKGRVLDAMTGKPLPFVAVFFDGSQTGTSTDDNGEYSLTTRDHSLTLLRASLIGYKGQAKVVSPGVFTEALFFLYPEENRLSAVTVKADNSKAKRLLHNIDANRDRNNPELRPGYSCDVYSKAELDISHPREQLRGKALNKQWKFIFDYIDTSDISGVPYLPIMINESVSKRYHSSDPTLDREEIVATQLSGADPSGNLISQFTGSLHLRNNFYSQFINAFNVEIPSPINSSGLLFYNYYIIDSLMMDGRKTYHVRYHPKPAISTPAFDGEMFVDTQDWALRSIKAKMVHGQNVNWVRDMALEASYQRLEDSTWFYRSDRFYADFSVAVTADSSKLLSIIGNRVLEFSNPEFGPTAVNGAKTLVTVEKDAGYHDEAYWDSVRPYELTQKEKDIYSMVDRIQSTNLYTTLYDVVYTIINGYWDIGKVGIGPYLGIFSFNPLEGFRLKMGAHTSVEWSKTHRFSGYLAYGFKDREFKGGLTWEYLISKEPTRKLTVDAHYDVLQLGRGTNMFNEGNILASIMGAGTSQKLLPVTEVSAQYDHEVNGNFNTASLLMFRQYHSNAFAPMQTLDGNVPIRTITSGEANVQFRFSHNETVTRGHFIKTYTHTDFPIVTLGLSGGVFGLNPWDMSGVPAGMTGSRGYFKPELSLDWKFRIPPVGMTTLHANVGTIVGRVPYTILHLHEGNGTYLLDKTSFSTMDFFEFASDSWATLLIDHNFYGFFLGKIPLLKKLQLREAITLRATWGNLSARNDGSWTADADGGKALSNPDASALMYFPEGMKSLGKIPYVEAGFAITNILRLFRVDFIWRCTHRDDPRPHPRNFVVNAGIELKF